MRIKFWGVRGSIPTPEHRNHRYGGNTTCVEVRLDDGTIFILDCGSGVRPLGKSLEREFEGKSIQAYVLMSHFHWDHIQGVPFFAPLYRPGNTFLFLSVKRKKSDLQGLIEGQMGSPHFPVDMGALLSARSFWSLDYGEISVQSATIRTAPLNHPQGCVAFRIDADGASLVFATDTEPGSVAHDHALRNLAEGADLLIYDAQYTPEQLQGERKGWGHSTWLEGVRIARECGIRRLALTHHDPESDDVFVDGLVKQARELMPEIEGASEGLEIDLAQDSVLRAYEANLHRKERRYSAELPIRLTWGNNGHTGEAEGLLLNVSQSALYFLAPDSIPSDKIMEVTITIPNELTRHGELISRFTALPTRKNWVSRTLAGTGSCVGVLARRIEDSEIPQDYENVPSLKTAAK
ncbi:MAG: MBL fold metallo-hydrolase [Acidobacteria bacterium]|nr:MBL fold metallo-hydrolase [Acidobacteriota bacterium]